MIENILITDPSAIRSESLVRELTQRLVDLGYMSHNISVSPWSVTEPDKIGKYDTIILFDAPQIAEYAAWLDDIGYQDYIIAAKADIRGHTGHKTLGGLLDTLLGPEYLDWHPANFNEDDIIISFKQGPNKLWHAYALINWKYQPLCLHPPESTREQTSERPENLCDYCSIATNIIQDASPRHFDYAGTPDVVVYQSVNRLRALGIAVNSYFLNWARTTFNEQTHGAHWVNDRDVGEAIVHRSLFRARDDGKSYETGPDFRFRSSEGYTVPQPISKGPLQLELF